MLSRQKRFAVGGPYNMYMHLPSYLTRYVGPLVSLSPLSVSEAYEKPKVVT